MKKQKKPFKRKKRAVRVDDCSEDFRKTFGEVVKRKRNALNLTQGEMSQVLGLSVATVNTIENGYSNPPFERAVRVCKIFDITIGCMMDDVDVTPEREKLAIALTGGLEKLEDEIVSARSRLTFLEDQRALANRVRGGSRL